MTLFRGFLILIFSGCSLGALAEDTAGPTVKAAWMGWLKDGELYIAAAQPKNHLGFEEQLGRLWSSSPDRKADSPKRSVRVSIKDLEEIFGEIDRNYIAIYQNEVYAYEPVSAHILVWGCDGSLVPVISLGPSTFTNDPYDWGIRVLSLSEAPVEVSVKPAPKEVIPPEFYGPLDYPQAYEISINSKQSYIYIDRDPDHEVDPNNILINLEQNSEKRILQKSIFDIRC